MGEIALGAAADGRSLSDLSKELPAGVQITMVRVGNENVMPSEDLVLSHDNGLLVVSDSEEALGAGRGEIRTA